MHTFLVLLLLSQLIIASLSNFQLSLIFTIGLQPLLFNYRFKNNKTDILRLVSANNLLIYQLDLSLLKDFPTKQLDFQ